MDYGAPSRKDNFRFAPSNVKKIYVVELFNSRYFFLRSSLESEPRATLLWYQLIEGLITKYPPVEREDKANQWEKAQSQLYNDTRNLHGLARVAYIHKVAESFFLLKGDKLLHPLTNFGIKITYL